MRSPSHPSSQPASNDCHRLAQPGFAVYSCVTVSGPSGTITEVTSGEAHQVLYSVYRREGAVARLVLVNTGGTDGPPVTFHRVDLAHDGDLKLLAVQKASANAPVSSVGAFDVVEGSGKVVLHVALGGGGGQIAPAPGGGVAEWRCGFPRTGAPTSSIASTGISKGPGEWSSPSGSPPLPPGQTRSANVPGYRWYPKKAHASPVSRRGAEFAP